MSSPPPWTQLSADAETDHRILRIRDERWRNPRNGLTLPITRVSCPDWVNVLPLTPDGRVVMVRQFRFGIGTDTLEIPGGMIEPGEDPAVGARRELLEETGYVPAALRPLGFTHPNPAFQTNKTFLYVAEGCQRQGAPQQDDGEDVRVELHPADSLDALVLSGKITHSLVLVTFLMHKLHAHR